MSMFKSGQVLKVKVESAPGEYGFGRATIIDRAGKNLLVDIRTSKDGHRQPGRGTRIWFVNDSPRLTFNGMWSSQVVGTQIVKGRTVLVCSYPKLEPLSQRRTAIRVHIEVPVTISLDIGGKEKQEFKTVDLCKSGSAIETSRLDNEDLQVGQEIGATLHSRDGDIKLTARIIRVEHNWLANKTTIALEFVALSRESSDILDRLLLKLGGKPRSTELERLAGNVSNLEGMKAWIQQVRKDGAEDAEYADEDENLDREESLESQKIDPSQIEEIT